MLDWRGQRVADNTILATGRAMNGLLADCVVEAKQRVPVRTSVLQGSIQMRPARQLDADTLVAYWGSFAVRYARFVEEGTAPHIIRPRTAGALYWPGAAHPVPLVHHPGSRARPFLKPVAEQRYPELPTRIRYELAKSAGRKLR